MSKLPQPKAFDQSMSAWLFSQQVSATLGAVCMAQARSLNDGESSALCRRYVLFRSGIRMNAPWLFQNTHNMVVRGLFLDTACIVWIIVRLCAVVFTCLWLSLSIYPFVAVHIFSLCFLAFYFAWFRKREQIIFAANSFACMSYVSMTVKFNADFFLLSWLRELWG